MNSFILNGRYFDPESGRVPVDSSGLFILLGHESFQYCILDSEKNSFYALADFILPSTPKTPEDFIAEISGLILQEEALQKKYPSVVIGISSVVQTLVPTPFFQADQCKKYLELNFSMNGNEEVRSEHIEEVGVYNVYSIPHPLRDALNSEFAGASIYHRSSALVRSFDHHQVPDPGYMALYLNVRDQFIDLVSFEGTRLAGFNSYSCPGGEDILYYTLNTLEQLKLSADNTQLFLSGMIDSGAGTYRLLEQYIRNITFTATLDGFEYSPLLKQLPAHRYIELYSLALCG
jgi:hypothetical protein